MSGESKVALRAAKVAGIIMSICDLYNVSVQRATDIYYRSVTSDMIEEGVADLQCRSNKYLATVIWDEFNEQHC